MRYRLCVLFALTVLSLSGHATPLVSRWDEVEVMHAWEEQPKDWESIGFPHTNTTIDLFVALKPHNETALIDTLYDVSTPTSKNYGAHLSKKEAAKLVEPHPNTTELVHSWLADCGVHPSTISAKRSNWLTITGVPVTKANEILGASYQLYRHTETNDLIIRTISYSLPTMLHPHVFIISPTTHFASPGTLQPPQQKNPVGAVVPPAKKAPRNVDNDELPVGGEDEVTPEFLRWLYKTEFYKPIAITQNQLGIAGFNNEFVSLADLRIFLSELRTDAAADATFSVELINNGGFDQNNPGQEASMNMQYAQSIAYPTPHVFFSIGGKGRYSMDPLTYGLPIPGDDYLTWITYLLDQEFIPQTISISYGANENSFPKAYAEFVCNQLFAELGARGVSVLFSSGNDGVGSGTCKDSKGKIHFMPKFPATCTFVTSVGGTTKSLPEVGVELSGGGFSNYFPRPPYQSVAVPAYLRRLGRRNKGYFNRDGRGVPDVSAQAHNFLILVDREPYYVNGTSCATPTVAAIVALLNDFLVGEGRRPLGFLNTWLYGQEVGERPDAGMSDITTGRNRGCGGKYGFPATIGWDAVTGLGTPDFLELLHVIINTPGFWLDDDGNPITPPHHPIPTQK